MPRRAGWCKGCDCRSRTKSVGIELLPRPYGVVDQHLAPARAELDIERANLTKAMRDDIHERRDIIRESIVAFEALSASLYEKAGSLTISETENGPQFYVSFHGQRSKCITNMSIFCFDLMFTQLSLNNGPV